MARSFAGVLLATIAAILAPACAVIAPPRPPGSTASSTSGGGDAGPDPLPGTCTTDTECGAPAGQCGGTRCYEGVCGLDNRPMHDLCAEHGGQVCDGAGRCVACLGGADGETDPDCGGGLCPPCGLDQVCAIDADCASTRCTAGLCAPTCTDGAKNGAEGGVDCGAVCPLLCAPESACGGAADCQSTVCQGAVYQAPTCADGVTNGGEPAIDCGGPNRNQFENRSSDPFPSPLGNGNGGFQVSLGPGHLESGHRSPKL